MCPTLWRHLSSSRRALPSACTCRILWFFQYERYHVLSFIQIACLILQDMASWTRDGVAGLQSVVLYSLPELDGAIDTVPLGGLVGNDIFLVQVNACAGLVRARCASSCSAVSPAATLLLTMSVSMSLS